MNVPFTAREFLQVFTDYNAAIWPMQLVAYALGAAALVLALRRHRLAGVAVSLILALLWAFTGIGYHILTFAGINPVARIFGAVFVVQAALLAFAGLRGRLAFRAGIDLSTGIGLAFVAYAMVVYPLLGFAMGHGYPNGPVFGLTPCPLVIFTFGMLLLADRPPRHLTVLPLLWAFVGSTAVLAFGMGEDLGLLVSAAVGTALILLRGRASTRATRGALRPLSHA